MVVELSGDCCWSGEGGCGAAVERSCCAGRVEAGAARAAVARAAALAVEVCRARVF